MSMDFSGANPNGQMGGGDLIPKGTLAWAILSARPFNADQGIAETPSKSTDGNAYLDVELTIEGGQHDRRKVWDKIGVAGSEKYVNSGHAAIRHILEVGNNAGPHNPAGYKIDSLFDLDGMRCAIRIGFEAGKDSYKDKNTVEKYLSPNPESDTNKDFVRLVNNDTAPKAAALPPPAVPVVPAQPSWGPGAASTPAHPTQPQPSTHTALSAAPAAPNAWGAGTAPTVSPSNQSASAPGSKPAWLTQPAR